MNSQEHLQPKQVDKQPLQVLVEIVIPGKLIRSANTIILSELTSRYCNILTNQIFHYTKLALTYHIGQLDNWATGQLKHQ